MHQPQSSLKELPMTQYTLFMHVQSHILNLNSLFVSRMQKYTPNLTEFVALDQVRYVGVSNETSYGVMEFVHAAKVEGLPKIVSIQNNYSLLVRCRFEGKSFFEHCSLESDEEQCCLLNMCLKDIVGKQIFRRWWILILSCGQLNICNSHLLKFCCCSKHCSRRWLSVSDS